MEENWEFASSLRCKKVRNQMIAERAQKNKELSLTTTASSDEPIETNHQTIQAFVWSTARKHALPALFDLRV